VPFFFPIFKISPHSQSYEININISDKEKDKEN
jgi:hypothetical protein